MKDHRDLEVWKKGIDFVTRLYAATRSFPKDEMYGLTNQMRRAAVSIPANIAEGAARHSDKEFMQFLYISLGSAAELETHIVIAEKLNYLKQPKELYGEIESIRKMLLGLIKYLKQKSK